jgi:hypothetical protein
MGELNFFNQLNRSVTTVQLPIGNEHDIVTCSFADIIKSNYNVELKPSNIPNNVFYNPNKFDCQYSSETLKKNSWTKQTHDNQLFGIIEMQHLKKNYQPMLR